MANQFAKILFFGLLVSSVALADEEKATNEEEKAPDWAVETLTAIGVGGALASTKRGSRWS